AALGFGFALCFVDVLLGLVGALLGFGVLCFVGALGLVSAMLFVGALSFVRARGLVSSMLFFGVGALFGLPLRFALSRLLVEPALELGAAVGFVFGGKLVFRRRLDFVFGFLFGVLGLRGHGRHRRHRADRYLRERGRDLEADRIAILGKRARR